MKVWEFLIITGNIGMLAWLVLPAISATRHKAEEQNKQRIALQPQLTAAATSIPQTVPLVKEYSACGSLYPGYEILVDKATGTRVLCATYSYGVALLTLPPIPVEHK